jgi:hypothetical protein
MILLPLLLATALQQNPAPASPPPGQQPPATIIVEPVAMFLAACDADADGRTTRAELAACTARTFAGADPGRRGSLGYIDFADWSQRWLGDRNALPSPFSVDIDHDDRITPAELEASLGEAFTRFDKNKDGALTRAELLTIQTGLPPMERGGKRRGGKRR